MMFGRNDGIGLVVDDIPKGTVGVEIGVWRGESSERLLEKASFLHLVDPWTPVVYEDSDEFGDYQEYLKRYSKLVGSEDPDDFKEYYDKVYRTVCRRFDGKPVTIHRTTSARFFADFEEKVDWVYIDGAHSLEGCLNDLIGAVCMKGVSAYDLTIYGDDFLTKPGVTRAVRDFLDMIPTAKFEHLGRRQYKITFGASVPMSVLGTGAS